MSNKGGKIREGYIREFTEDSVEAKLVSKEELFDRIDNCIHSDKINDKEDIIWAKIGNVVYFIEGEIND